MYWKCCFSRKERMMTRKDAIEILKTNPLYSQELDLESDYYKSMSTALRMAIKSLEVFDTIRDEIGDLPIERGLGVFDCLTIINKYLKQIEDCG